MKRKFLFCFFVFFLHGSFFPQENPLDSLKSALKNAKEDTVRLKLLVELSEQCETEDIPAYTGPAVELAKQKLKNTGMGNALRAFYLKCLADAFINIGFYAGEKDDAAKALQYYSRSLKIREELSDKNGMATALNNIGVVYKNMGDVPAALQYYSKSLKIIEELGDKNRLAASLGNIGLIYFNQGDNSKAMEYFTRQLKIMEEVKDKKGIAKALDNLGHVYVNRNENEKALENYSGSLKIWEELGDKNGIALSNNNIGTVYNYKEEVPTALAHYLKALNIYEETGNKSGIAATLINVGGMYLKQGNLNKAAEASLRSLKISREIGYPQYIRNAAKNLKQIYQRQNKFKEALEMYELFIQMRDSISNQATRKASVKTQLKYEYEKKAAADSVKNAELRKVTDAQLAAQTATIKQEKFQRYSLIVGLLIVACGLLFVINRFRITQKQKKIIEAQKVKVDEAFDKLHEKNKEVMDSIYYARRIQRALITNEKYIERKLNEMNNR